MKKIVLLTSILAFCAGIASAAIVITLNQYSDVQMTLQPVGSCGPVGSGDCIFKVTMFGNTLDTEAKQRSREERSYYTTDAGSPFNAGALSAQYRKGRKLWTTDVLNDTAE